jgi:hypothetical protein
MAIFKKNKKLISIILAIFIILAALIIGLIKMFVLGDISSEDFRNSQLVNGRYYYLKTKTVSLSNIEYDKINNTRKEVYNDKYFKQESISEKWEDLGTIDHNKAHEYKQIDMRSNIVNQDGVLIFDKAFIGGNYFTCSECATVGQVEEEISGELPIDPRIENIFVKLKNDPWRGSSRNMNINRLYDLQFNHNYDARQLIFNILKFAFWDDIDFLGKVEWEGRQVYGFRIIDKNLATIHTMYFDIEKIRYIGEEQISRSYTGDDMGDMVRARKTVVLEENYSNYNSGVNSDGLARESEGAINQMLDRKCAVDTDCEGITGYTVEVGSCPTYLNRCVDGQCALMCRNESQRSNSYCNKYDKETQAFISYTCQENTEGVSRLVVEAGSEFGICKVSNSDEKTIFFYECVDDEDGKIELLNRID